VIPCVMVNTDKIQPTGRRIPRLRPRPGVRFGKPLDFSRYEGMAGDRFVERSMTDEIMYELMQLSGQEYVDVYAAKVKAAQGSPRAFGANSSRVKDELREAGDRVPTERAS
jgi:1-acyl-sn-glycerol-3-phosphate acyltransferase